MLTLNKTVRYLFLGNDAHDEIIKASKLVHDIVIRESVKYFKVFGNKLFYPPRFFAPRGAYVLSSLVDYVTFYEICEIYNSIVFIENTLLNGFKKDIRDATRSLKKKHRPRLGKVQKYILKINQMHIDTAKAYTRRRQELEQFDSRINPSELLVEWLANNELYYWKLVDMCGFCKSVLRYLTIGADMQVLNSLEKNTKVWINNKIGSVTTWSPLWKIHFEALDITPCVYILPIDKEKKVYQEYYESDKFQSMSKLYHKSMQLASLNSEIKVVGKMVLGLHSSKKYKKDLNIEIAEASDLLKLQKYIGMSGNRIKTLKTQLIKHMVMCKISERAPNPVNHQDS